MALLEPMSQEAYVTVLHTANREAERLGSLINDLLELARADEGYLSLHHEQVRLDRVVDAIVANAEPLVEEHQLHIQVEASHPVLIIGDEARLIQMVMNVLDNAIHYTNPGGQITVTVHEKQRHAQFCVQDTGRGIAAEHLPHIFERFYRVDAAHPRTEWGSSGLGLAIVEWIIRVHRGSVTVESTPGQGSTFTILLPLASEELAVGVSGTTIVS